MVLNRIHSRLEVVPDICPSCEGKITALPPREDRLTSYKWYKCITCNDHFQSKYRHDTRLSKFRTRLFQILGGARCVCDELDCCHKRHPCIIADERCLQFDHMSGEGYAHIFGKRYRSKPTREFYEYYVNRPDLAKKELQVLCANCNWIKRSQKEECSVSRKKTVRASKIMQT